MSANLVADLLVPLLRGGGGTEVTSGRVTTFAPDNSRGTIAGVTITDRPEHGNLTVNPDGSLALVLTTSDYTGSLSFGYTLRYADGRSEALTAQLKVVPGSQKGGWGEGEHYRLATDDDGRSILEPGENHRKVHVSAGNDALSVAEIAAREGISAKAIDGEWLKAHAEYGSTPGLALGEEAGLMLWEELTRKAEPSSHWLLLERGHDYGGFGNFLVQRQTTGESELHPVVIGAYGQGDRPTVTSYMRMYKEASDNVVVRDIAFSDGIQVLSGSDLLFENIALSGDKMLNANGLDRFTLRDATIVDVTRADSASKGYWEPGANKVSGIFVKKTDGVLIEDTLFDHNGWADGYDPDGSLSKGQPPSFFSHNVYIQHDNTDVTFRDNIVMRGASFGAQVRPGGFIEDNVFLDNNAAVNFLGGSGGSGNYTLFADNVVTSAAYKQWEVGGQGALSMGIRDSARDSSLIDNIVAHLADPNNAAEQLRKKVPHDALKSDNDPFFDDTIIYNWNGEEKPWRDNQDRNLDGLDPAKLDQTTIQLYAEKLTGKNDATIADLAQHLRARAAGELDGVNDADLIVAFFQAGFGGIAPGIRSKAETLRFVPDERGDGIRWDNRLNWTTEDLPGTAAGDSVDLGGNWVHSTATAAVRNLEFGSGGALAVWGGAIGVTGDLSVGQDGGTLKIDGAGQVWTAGYSDADRLTVRVDGGRFANTGVVDGTLGMTVTGGEAILATGGARFTLASGDRLAVTGGKVGFDGPAGEAVLRLADDAALHFAAKDGEIGGIGEFRSGHWGTSAPGVRSTVDLGAGTATLELALAGMGAKALSGTLVRADTLTGGFGDIDVTGIGAGTGVEVGIDYGRDLVTVAAAGAPKDGARFQLTYRGSDAADRFQIGEFDGFATAVLGFDRNDILDLTALLAAEGAKAGAVSFRSVDASHTDVLVGGAAAARLAHTSRIKDFEVGGANGRTVVSADTLGPLQPGDDEDYDDEGGIGGLPSSQSPRPSPEPIPEPKPEPEPGGGDDVNRAPEARSAKVSTAEDRSYSGQVSAKDGDGDALRFSPVDGPDDGTLKLSRDGSFTYRPDQNFNGRDTFSFKVTDGETSDTATVSIAVAAVNDAPSARNDAFAGGADGRFTTGNVLRNDRDADGDRLRVTTLDTEGTKGRVTDNGDGTFRYDPGSAFEGLGAGKTATDRFGYTVTDRNGGSDTATVTVRLTGTGGDTGGNTGGGETILGSNGRDSLTGTRGNDTIESRGGSYDWMEGKGGADHFVFGTESRNGLRERDVIADYQVGRDLIVLDGAKIGAIEDASTGAVIFLKGDGDRIYIQGDDVTAGALTIVAGNEETPYDWPLM